MVKYKGKRHHKEKKRMKWDPKIKIEERDRQKGKQIEKENIRRWKFSLKNKNKLIAW